LMKPQEEQEKTKQNEMQKNLKKEKRNEMEKGKPKDSGHGAPVRFQFSIANPKHGETGSKLNKFQDVSRPVVEAIKHNGSVDVPKAVEITEQRCNSNSKGNGSGVAVKHLEDPAMLKVVPTATSATITPATTSVAGGSFNAALFHKAVWAILCDLRKGGDVLEAVHKIHAWHVPSMQQANEFADLITRAVEEKQGPARCSAFALVSHLASVERGVFGHAECLAGIRIFFSEVYEDLCEEVPQLPGILSAELLPALRSVFPVGEIQPLVPRDAQLP